MTDEPFSKISASDWRAVFVAAPWLVGLAWYFANAPFPYGWVGGVVACAVISAIVLLLTVEKPAGEVPAGGNVV